MDVLSCFFVIKFQFMISINFVILKEIKTH
jgi:hypothetical protein